MPITTRRDRLSALNFGGGNRLLPDPGGGGDAHSRATGLGLFGSRSLGEKIIEAIQAVGAALKRVRKPVQQVDPEILSQIRADRLAQAEAALSANMSAVHDAKRSTVVAAQVRTIQADARREAADPNAELVEIIEPIVERVVDRKLGKKDDAEEA